MNLELWHRVLSAELSIGKCRELHRVLGTSAIDSMGELLALPFLTDTDRARIRGADLDAFEGYREQGVQILTPAEYPASLAELELPPLGLYCWGDAQALDSPCIGIVGTRRAGSYGRLVAARFAQEFARAGVTVVSGGALGIDAAAHQGALDADGKTAAVLITGIESVYPRQHSGLFSRIRAQGCLISQFPIGTKSAWEYRPLARNRTISALCSAILVVEAPLSSGALTTAAEAADMGRPVFVVPGPIDNLNFQGSHMLIREGATLADHPVQVLQWLGISPAPAAPPAPKMEGTRKALWQHLSSSPLSAESLAAKTGLSDGEVLAELTTMEVEGLVARMDGRYAKL